MKFQLLIIFVLLIILQSCKYDKLKPIEKNISLNAIQINNNCGNLSSVSFSLQVQSIINSKCISCHDASSSIKLHNYSNVSLFANSGQLIGCLTGDPSYAQMPPSGSLDSCSIKIIVNWVNQGKLNN